MTAVSSGSLESLTVHIRAAHAAAADAVARLAYVDACIGGTAAIMDAPPPPRAEVEAGKRHEVIERVRAVLVAGPRSMAGIASAARARCELVHDALNVLLMRREVERTACGYSLVARQIYPIAHTAIGPWEVRGQP